jgi:hypothetical protein
MQNIQHYNKLIKVEKLKRINSHVHPTCIRACFHPIKNVYRDKNILLLCHLSEVIKIVFLITIL